MEEVLGMFVGDKIIQQWEGPEGEIFTVAPEKRIYLDYYKNNILHFFLPFSLAASVFKLHGTDQLSENRFLEGLGYFMRLFSKEFIFPPEDAVRNFWRTASYHFAVKRNFLSIDDGGEIRVEDPSTFSYFADFLRNYFESYYVVFYAIGQISGDQDCEEKEFLKQVLDLADSFYRQGDLVCSESRSTFIFRNAMAFMFSQGFIRRSRTKAGVSLVWDESGSNKIEEYRQTLKRLLFPEEQTSPSKPE